MPRGGFGDHYKISFAGRAETAEEIFGTKELSPAQMTKALWAYVKGKGLEIRKPYGK